MSKTRDKSDLRKKRRRERDRQRQGRLDTIQVLVDQGNYDSAVRLLQVEVERRPTVETRRLLALGLFHIGEYQAAAAQLALIPRPQPADLLFAGQCWSQAQDWPAAAACLERAVQGQPDPTAYYMLATARCQGQPDGPAAQSAEVLPELRALLRQAIRLPGCPPAAAFWLGRLAMGEEPAPLPVMRQREAQVWAEALEFNPDSAEIRFRLAEYLVYWSSDYARTEAVLAPLLQGAHYAPEVAWLAARTKQAQGDMAAALGYLARIPWAEEGMSVAKVRGDLLAAQGDLPGAVQHFAHDLARPDREAQVIALFSRAEVRLRQGDQAAAVADAQAACALVGADARPVPPYLGAYLVIGPRQYPYPQGNECIRAVCAALLGAPDAHLLPDVATLLLYLQYTMTGEQQPELLLRAYALSEHPKVAEALVPYYASIGDWAAAVQGHLAFAIWEVYLTKANTHALGAPFWDNRACRPALTALTAAERAAIHAAALEYLRAYGDDKTLPAVFQPFYRRFWRPLLLREPVLWTGLQDVGAYWAERAAADMAATDRADYAAALGTLGEVAAAEATMAAALAQDPALPPTWTEVAAALAQEQGPPLPAAPMEPAEPAAVLAEEPAPRGSVAALPPAARLAAPPTSASMTVRLIRPDNGRANGGGATKRLFDSGLERVVYRCLTGMLPVGYTVVPNASLSAIFVYDQMKERLSPAAFAYFLKARVDILIVRADFRPLLALELDSPFHDAAGQALRDRTKDTIFRQGGLLLLRLRPLALLDESQIAAEVAAALQSAGVDICLRGAPPTGRTTPPPVVSAATAGPRVTPVWPLAPPPGRSESE